MPRRVAHYELHESLGRGGMGVVYRATDTLLGRAVALKFLPTELAVDEHGRKRFVREATAASSLDHPNICTIYQIGSSDEGELYIVMACYEGQTVRELLSSGPLPVDVALDYAYQTALGLAHAHTHDVVHRDIKPANLMVTGDGLLKRLDFGLARTASISDLTATGQLLGTLKYMAPEQINGEPPVDHRADIWALGVVLYEMLTGTRPFEGSATQILDAVRSVTPVPVRRLRPEVTTPISDIVSRAMARDLNDRYPSIDVMLSELRDQVSGKGEQTRTRSAPANAMAETVTIQLPATDTAHAEVRIPTIAVLPFENLFDDPEDQFFSEGLTDELTHALSSQRGVRVIARSSVQEFRSRGIAMSQVGEVLGVDAVVEGSIRRAGNKIRVVARFVDAEDGRQVWSEKYDREVDDIFAIQDEIAASIADRLKLEVSEYSGVHEPTGYHGPADVYELYVRGRRFQVERAFDKARQCYTEAIERDPDFAHPHAGLAGLHAARCVYGGADPQEAWPQVRRSVLRALELDRNLAEAHLALGYLRTFEDWDWKAAERAFVEAVRLGPSQLDTRISMTMHYIQTGRFQLARNELAVARQLDPLSPLVQGFVVGCHLYWREYEESVRLGDAALETSQAFDIRLFRALSLQRIERFDEAESEFRQLHELTGGGALTAGFLGGCLAECGREDEAQALLETLQDSEDGHFIPPSSRALILIGLRDRDRAIEELNAAADVRDSFVCYAGVLPALDYLRDDERFSAFLARIGLGDSGRTGIPDPSN